MARTNHHGVNVHKMPEVLCFLIVFVLALNAAAMAAEPVRVPWSRVAVLVRNAEVTVETAGKRKKVQGRVANVRPDSIELRTQTGNISLPSAEVTRIRVHGKNQSLGWVLLGAAGGAGLFALAAHPSKPLFGPDWGLSQRNPDGTYTRLDSSPHPNCGLAAAAGAGAGAAAGWFAGRLSRSRALTIVIAPDPDPPPPAPSAQLIRGEPQ